MTKETILKSIHKKFGTISKFARLSGIDRYELQKTFARKQVATDVLKNIMKRVNETPLSSTDGEISELQLLLLKARLEDEGGVIKFCRDNPRFSKDSVFQILNGRRKRMTPKVKELFAFLKLEEKNNTYI